jgi:Fe-coproporphyrin III synthase
MLTPEAAKNSSPDAKIEHLPVLVLNIHNRCNCRCLMCDIWKTDQEQRLSVATLDALMPALRRLKTKWVVFTGGEPLMNVEAPLLGQRLRGIGMRVTLLSTGILLQRYADAVAASFDDVIVSLDGPPSVHDHIRRVPGAFGLLEQGVKAVKRRRPSLSITCRTTVQRENRRDLCRTVETAKQVGLDGISFLAVDSTSPAFHRDLVWPIARNEKLEMGLPEVQELSDEVDRLQNEWRSEIASGYIRENPAKLRRIVAQFRARLGLERQCAPTCNAPWKSAVISLDGSVQPCFFHQALGNLRQGELDEVLNSTAARSFRSNLDIASNPICQRCVCSLNYRDSAAPEQLSV